jgi:hypothetical protein
MDQITTEKCSMLSVKESLTDFENNELPRSKLQGAKCHFMRNTESMDSRRSLPSNALVEAGMAKD